MFAKFDFSSFVVIAEAACIDLCFSNLQDFVSLQFEDCSKMPLHFKDLWKLLMHLEHEEVKKYFLSNFTSPKHFLSVMFTYLSSKYRSCKRLQN